ncbi:MAG TPA: DUF6268 family outer membrane beta-barrel protein [Planctomycetaceae bacterium]|nr:DUF6268 family outer membrane beta-barrel protein [Planctomycetaceae bacterium]
MAATGLVAVAVSWPAYGQDWLTLRGQSDDVDTERSASYLQYEPQNSTLPTPPQQLLPDPSVVDDPLLAPQEPLPPIAPYGTQFVMTWNSGSGDGLGITTFDLRQTLVFPRVQGLMLNPGIAAHALNGPLTTDLPPSLYDAWLEFRWLKKINDRWMLDLVVTPSYFSDFENKSNDAFRLPGRALAMWTATPEVQLLFGVINFDREDVGWLPAAGLIWTPNDDYKVELLFPRPRVMRKLSEDDCQTRWVYAGGEFGGGSWAINREDGTEDVVTYSVLRFLVGYEAKKKDGFSPRVEAGYLFGRSIEYRSGIGDYDPDSAFMLRFGGSF